MLFRSFGTGELLARLRAALRHTARTAAEPVVTFGPIRVDLGRRQVFKAEEEVHVTATEWRILALLVQNSGKVLTHAQVLREVWGPNHGDHMHYVRVYMAELRKKLEDDPARPRWLTTEVGVGYRLREEG